MPGTQIIHDWSDGQLFKRYVEKAVWKCPECDLFNLTTLDTPCIACFWNISDEEKVLLELVTANKRNTEILPLLSRHMDADVCGLILEYLPRVTLLDCSMELGENSQMTQKKWLEAYKRAVHIISEENEMIVNPRWGSSRTK